MINTLKSKLSIMHPIESLNNLAGMVGIGVKEIGEDIGLVNQYGVTNTKLKKKTKNLLENARN